MNPVTDHKGSDANATISIACDDRAEGGASHIYDISYEWQSPSAETGGTGVQRLEFQRGAIKEVGRNGITDEVLIAVLLDRLRGFQNGPFKCRENSLAVTKLEEALHWMNHRTNERVARGVEGRSVA